MKFFQIKTMLLCLSSTILSGQSILEIDREGIMLLTSNANDTTYVINFWATWCSPCVKEIGYFEELHRKNVSSTVKVILVSLDFPNQVESRVNQIIN